METFFYLDDQDQPVGPFRIDELIALSEAGVIHENTLVGRQGDQVWVPFSSMRSYTCMCQEGGSSSVKSNEQRYRKRHVKESALHIAKRLFTVDLIRTTGRVTRREYLIYVLCVTLSYLVCLVLAILARQAEAVSLTILSMLVTIVFTIVAVISCPPIMIRRLHDIGHSAKTFLLVSLIPIIGLPILALSCIFIDSQRGTNSYGPSQKYPDDREDIKKGRAYSTRMGAGEVFKLTLTYNLTKFSGRATRREYWMYQLCAVLSVILLSIFLSVILLLFGNGLSPTEYRGGDSLVVEMIRYECSVIWLIAIGFKVALFVSELSITTRRLRDAGFSPWALLLLLIPILGPLVIVILTLMGSQPEEGSYDEADEPTSESVSKSDSGASRMLRLSAVLPTGERWESSLPLSVLSPDGIYIGRQSARCKIVIPESSVSRCHARLWRTPEGIAISDENSCNGVFVNGRRLASSEEVALLHDGDIISLGEVAVRAEII